jgi:hypothetical protein
VAKPADRATPFAEVYQWFLDDLASRRSCFAPIAPR